MVTISPHPEPYYSDAESGITVHHGDCIEVLRRLPDCSVDAVVTDPPYGIRFMGKAWDGADIVNLTERWRVTNPMPKEVGGPHGGYRSLATEAGRYRQTQSANLEFQLWVNAWAVECLRVLKPGGHLLASGSPRTWHRLTAGIEDAGFEIRDSIAWMFGSGFPKSLDVSKAIDKHLGANRRVTGRGKKGNRVQSTWGTNGATGMYRDGADGYDERNEAATPAAAAAAAAAGLGTALKPAFEPIVVARKPLAGTVAANWMEHGTGALNIDASRLQTNDSLNGGRISTTSEGWDRPWKHDPEAIAAAHERGSEAVAKAEALGRWPANVILDESQAVELDAQTGDLTSGFMKAETDRTTRQGDAYGQFAARTATETYGDTGGPSRFFYVAKADQSERVRLDGVAHPTVKPLSLMHRAARLVTPPGGTVLEPFTGSGTTVEACLLEGFQCIAIEREADYLPLIVQRINRRRDPVAAVKATGDDAGLFDLLDGGAA